MNKILNSKGFTLIELLVVIAIIGVLASIVVVTLSGSTTSAKDAATVANLRSIPSVITSKIDPDNPSTFSGAGACDLCLKYKMYSRLSSQITLNLSTGSPKILY